MGETGIGRFPGNLDPRAQEFRPTTQITTLFRPPQVYYPYAAPHPSPYASNDVQVVPFSDAGGGYLPYPAHPLAYVSPSAGAGAGPACQVAVHLPPPSACPTRTLVLSSVAGDVSETIVRRDLEVFGEVRGVQMERVMEGIVTVHFYDLRHAEMAFKEIREQHMQLQQLQQTYRLQNPYSSGLMMLTNNNNSATCYDNQVVESLMMVSYAPVQPLPARGLVNGRPVWPQFIVPACNAVPDGNNQGTIVVFNLDSGVSSASLREIFQAVGSVKELRETPLKKHQRFIEFYDVRDAAKALKEMNGQVIYGKSIVIEFSRPGGHSSRKFFNANANTTTCTSNIINCTYQIQNSDYPPLAQQPMSSSFSTHPPSYSPRSFISRQTQNFRKKSPSNSFKGNPNNVNSTYNTSSIEASVASLSLAGTIEDINPRRNSKKSQSSITKTQQVKNRSSRPWKGRQVKKLDARFLISEDAMVESNFKDPRTTVMIKNIPNKYSQKLLLNMLDNHCIHCNEQIAKGDDQPLSSYDFVYLPIDFNNKCNVGYGFVNMTSPEATWRLYKAFHLQNWEVFNSRKICEVTYARVQGFEALKEHFKNSKFPCEMDHYLPVVFSPPRDGRQLTEPLPVVGLGPTGHNKQSIGNFLTNPNATDHDHHDNFDGSDTLDHTNNSESDCTDQTQVLIGGGSSCSTVGGDVDDGDDDDRGSSSSSAVLLA